MNFLLGQTEGVKMAVFLKEDWGKRRVHSETSKTNWFFIRDQEISPFVKFEIIPPLLCYLSDPITNNYIKVLGVL